MHRVVPTAQGCACRYLNDKDMFERFYKQHLSKRLLSGRATNDHIEHIMLSKLKAECGYQFTSKLEGMFADMKTSGDTMDTFRQHIESQGIALAADISVQVCLLLTLLSSASPACCASARLSPCAAHSGCQRQHMYAVSQLPRVCSSADSAAEQVLTTGNWPASASTPCVLPMELEASYSAFADFYKAKHSGRKLNWHSQMGTADLFCEIQGKRHTITVTTHQMCVLMVLNETPTPTLAQLLEVRPTFPLAFCCLAFCPRCEVLVLLHALAALVDGTGSTWAMPKPRQRAGHAHRQGGPAASTHRHDHGQGQDAAAQDARGQGDPRW